MRRLDVLGLAAILCSAPMVMGADPDAPSQARPAAATVAQDVNLFAADLYARLRSTEQGNLFFSPQSISTALAMTYAGARGQTAEEMARTLHFSLPQDRLPPAYAELLHTLRGGGTQGYRLSIANRLWGQRGLSFLAPFVEVTRRDYGAELGLVDFASNAEGARGEINGWVAKETEQKIRDLIPAGVLGPDTRLVLANAIYFRGDWARQFEKSATREQPFHVTGGTTVAVPLMFSRTTVGFAAQPDAGFKVVELPYKGDDLSISAVLHTARVDVDEQGTEAAAATGVAVGVRAMRPEEPPTFRADHPFVFFIRHNPTGAILFLGRLTNPKP